MASFPRRYNEIDTIRLNNITIRAADNSIPPDGYILTASTGRAYMLSPTFALDSVPGLSDLQGQISTLSTIIGTGGGGGASLWANYPAIDNINIANNDIYSTNTLAFVDGNNIISIDYVQLSNISTAAGGSASGGASLWATYPAVTDINTNSNSIYSTVNLTLLNNANTLNITYTTFSNISTATGQAFSTGQGLVPRVGALETFSTAQTTSNFRYDIVSTAFTAVSTTTGQAFSTGQGLVPRVGALETFSTAQTTSNIRYDIVSTAFTATSTTAGSLVPRVTDLETFSTAQTASNIRYDIVSTAFTATSTTAGSLVPRVTDLETFSTAQTTSNIRYDFISTVFTATSTATGQAFSTGQNLVPRVDALEIFSTSIVTTFTTSNLIANTTTVSSIVTSTISTFTASGTTNIQQMTELIDIELNATGIWPHNFNNGSIFYHSSMTANFTTALFNVPVVPGRGIITTLVLIQGATPYYSSTLTVNGSATPIQWANSYLPVPTAFKTECETFTLFNIGGTWSALGQYTSFGTV